MLSINTDEQLRVYDPMKLQPWRDPAWWQAESWRDVLPEREWRRVSKFRNQAAGPGLFGYHFTEVLHMQALEAAGYEWLYEEFDFFVPPGPSAKVFARGYEMICAAFGLEKVQRAQELAREYGPSYAPRRRPNKQVPTPDFFVYRTAKSGAIQPIAFHEVKRLEPLQPDQLLGLAIIKESPSDPCTGDPILGALTPSGGSAEPSTYV